MFPPATRKRQLESRAAERRDRQGKMVGSLRRPAAQCARRAGHRLEPIFERGSGAIPRGARRDPHRSRRRIFPPSRRVLLPPARANRRTGRSFGTTSPITYADYQLPPIDASWEPDVWGRVRRTGRGRPLGSAGDRRGSGERGFESPCGAGARLFPVARTRFAAAASGFDRRVVRAGAAIDRQPLQGRRRFRRGRGAGANAARNHARAGRRRRRRSHRIRACHRRPDRQAARPIQPAAFAADDSAAGDSAGTAFRTARAPAGHCRSRTPRAGSERADRRRSRRVLSGLLTHRRRRIRELHRSPIFSTARAVSGLSLDQPPN